MIIAECCQNFIDLDMAKKMILTAKEFGAGFCKFQLYNPEQDKDKPYYEFSKEKALDYNQAKDLFDYGKSIGMEVFFSVFGVEYVEWCEKIGVKRYKIACEFRDKDTLDVVRKTGKPTIISINYKSKKPFPVTWSWLWCIPEYPAIIHDMAMVSFNPLQYQGFSDHSIGLVAAKIALARGAQIVEKHFCLSRDEIKGYPDMPWSMEPMELAELVEWEKICQNIL